MKSRPSPPARAAPDEQDPAGFALSYPFARPAGSFVFSAATGGVATASDVEVSSYRTVSVEGLRVPCLSASVRIGGQRIELPDRIPVLASGSNAAPSQLARKYRDHPALPPVLVHEVEIEHVASVYSAHVARYGSVAATLAPCPGFTARLHVLLLPPQALPHLNATESLGGNYLLAELAGTPLRLGTSEIAPLAYLSRRGPARLGGAPRRLPGTGGAGGHPEASQEVMQRDLQALMGMGGDIRDFVARLIGDDAFRADATARLAASTGRVVPDGARILAGA